MIVNLVHAAGGAPLLEQRLLTSRSQGEAESELHTPPQLGGAVKAGLSGEGRLARQGGRAVASLELHWGPWRAEPRQDFRTEWEQEASPQVICNSLQGAGASIVSAANAEQTGGDAGDGASLPGEARQALRLGWEECVERVEQICRGHWNRTRGAPFGLSMIVPIS